MTTDLFLNSIKEWFDEYEYQLRKIVAEVDEDRRYHIEIEKSSEPRLLETLNLLYIVDCVEEPIRKILRFIKENRKCQVLDDSVSCNCHVEIEDVVLFLKILPIEYRKMLLKGFDEAIRDNPIVSEGVLQANLDKLMEAAQRFDLSAEFTQIGILYAFAQKYGTKSEQRLQLAEDIMTIKYINNDFTEIRKFFLLDKEREAGMRIWPWLEEFCKCYREMTYCFTNQEKSMINRLLQDEHFKVISKKMGGDVELIINEGCLDATEVSTLTLDSNENVSQEPHPEQLSAADSNQTPHRPGERIHSREIDNFDIWPNYFNHSPIDSDDHCKITNEEFYKIDAKTRAKMFEDFIKLLARVGCIDPDKTTMKSCAYAFTGYGFSSYGGFHVRDVYWHKDKVDILLFICTKLFKKNEHTSTNFAKALEVFHVTAKNCTKRAESVTGTEFDDDFTKIFGELK